MEVLYLLIPLAVVLAGVIVWAFFWSVKSGQFDDLEGPAHRILMDDKTPDSPDKSAAHDSREGGGRATQGAVAEGRADGGAEGRKSAGGD